MDSLIAVFIILLQVTLGTSLWAYFLWKKETRRSRQESEALASFEMLLADVPQAMEAHLKKISALRDKNEEDAHAAIRKTLDDLLSFLRQTYQLRTTAVATTDKEALQEALCNWSIQLATREMQAQQGIVAETLTPEKKDDEHSQQRQDLVGLQQDLIISRQEKKHLLGRLNAAEAELSLTKNMLNIVFFEYCDTHGLSFDRGDILSAQEIEDILYVYQTGSDAPKPEPIRVKNTQEPHEDTPDFQPEAASSEALEHAKEKESASEQEPSEQPQEEQQEAPVVQVPLPEAATEPKPEGSEKAAVTEPSIEESVPEEKDDDDSLEFDESLEVNFQQDRQELDKASVLSRNSTEKPQPSEEEEHKQIKAVDDQEEEDIVASEEEQDNSVITEPSEPPSSEEDELSEADRAMLEAFPEEKSAAIQGEAATEGTQGSAKIAGEPDAQDAQPSEDEALSDADRAMLEAFPEEPEDRVVQEGADAKKDSDEKR